ncbi:MAG TPA: protein phosphatase 2C domain-containing protein [Chthoniobacteraceae bacterium]|jgi:protein phosphatase|nr:protein phosphatase 2C domain-containing protein [Chthoniobacteraceae bacterium]
MSLPARHIHWSAHTDRGRVRPQNEDSYLALQFDAQEVHRLGKIGDAHTGDHHFVFAVSDGMGGAQAGEYASRVAMDKILHLLPQSFRQNATGVEAGYIEVLEEMFGEVDFALKYLGGSYPEDCQGMGATLSLCWLTAEWMYFAHIGDSRIYYLERATGTLKQISQDDTHIGWLKRNGKISEREAMHHPRRTALQKGLGSDYQFVKPQVGSVYLQPGDLFLLCSDGLGDGLFDSQIAERLLATNGAPDAAEAIIRASLESGAGKDNITAVVIGLMEENLCAANHE